MPTWGAPSGPTTTWSVHDDPTTTWTAHGGPPQQVNAAPTITGRPFASFDVYQATLPLTLSLTFGGTEFDSTSTIGTSGVPSISAAVTSVPSATEFVAACTIAAGSAGGVTTFQIYNPLGSASTTIDFVAVD